LEWGKRKKMENGIDEKKMGVFCFIVMKEIDTPGGIQ